MYGILLKGKDRVKCGVCKGEGVQSVGDRLRTCRACEGKGYVSKLKVAEWALARFGQPRIYQVSMEHSVVLRYEGYCFDEVIMALRALAISNIKAQLIFPI